MPAHAHALSLAALLGLAVTAGAQTTPSMAGHAGMAMAMPGERRDSALLTGAMGSPSPVGTVTVEGRTVRVAWSGDQPGSTRPWYVHKGSCDRDEGMVGSSSAYTPITVDASGAGSGTATLPGPLAASGAYFVAVHAGTPGATSAIVACGPLGSGGMRMREMAGMPGMGAGHDSAGAMQKSMSGMDHSTMNMSGMQPAGGGSGMNMSPSASGGASGAMESGGAMATMMALHRRMMADPVIRRRVMSNPTMRRMAEETTSQMSAGGGAMPSMSMPRKAAGASVASASHPSSAGPKQARKPTSKPAPKRDAMPGMDMKGMDHGSTPGMGGKP